jgi:hypothetical protein
LAVADVEAALIGAEVLAATAGYVPWEPITGAGRPILGRFHGELTLARTTGPWLSTPDSLIDPLLALADLDTDNVVVDLGCGDARILTAAVAQNGAGPLAWSPTPSCRKGPRRV